MPKIQFKIVQYMQSLFLFLLFFFAFHSMTSAQSGLINAMTFEDAEDIAIKSIRRASGIRVKEIELDTDMTYSAFSKRLKKSKYLRNCLTSAELKNYHEKGKENSDEAQKPVPDTIGLQNRMNAKCFPFKRMRLTDTLDFLGITDEFRLAALRSYIVKNVEFGVQNVWGVDANDIAQSYVLSGKQLEDIKTSTTVIDLAKKIQTSAALPFLSYSTAETLVRNCRYKVTGDNTKSVPLNKNIKDDIDSGIKKDAFKTCLDDASFWAKDANNVSVQYKYGVRSVKIVNNEGDPKFYYLTKDFKDSLNSIIDHRNYKYLVEKLVKSSGIPSSEKFIATQIVINALLRIEKKLVEEKSKGINPDQTNIQTARPFENIRVSRMLFQIYYYNCSEREKTLLEKISVKNDLNSLCIEADELTRKIDAEVKTKAYFKLENKALVRVNEVSLRNSLNDSMSIEQVINQVQID